MQLRRKHLVAPLAGVLVGALSIGIAAPAGAQDSEANGIRGIVQVLGTTLTNTPNTPHSESPPGGSSTLANLPAAAQPGATAGILSATSNGNSASSSVAGLSALNGVVPGVANVLTADAVTSQCSGSTGSSGILNGNANGPAPAGSTPLAASAPPNTTVAIPGVGFVVLNEQTPNGSGITVRAIHLSVNVGGLILAEYVIAESACLAGIEAGAAAATAGAAGAAGAAGLTG